MVNFGIFTSVDLSKPTNLMFQDRVRQRLFIILLRDFLSQVLPSRGQCVPLGLEKVPEIERTSLSNLTFLFHLRQVCKNPTLGSDSSKLGRQVEAFADWLEGEFTAENVWFPDIEVEMDLPITRYRYITMCGDITKHHLGRLSRIVHQIRSLLRQEHPDIDDQTAYLSVENFYEWFFDHIFIYHASQIAEFLNNIRWEVYEYLRPQYMRAYHLIEDATSDPHAYSYHVPETICHPIARAMYWDVMNRVGQRPLMQRFFIDEINKRRY